MRTDEIEELAKLSIAATPGPWEADGVRTDGEYTDGDDGGAGFTAREIVATIDGVTVVLFDSVNATSAVVDATGGHSEAFDRVALANADLIVAMRNKLPRLLIHVAEQAERIARLEENLAAPRRRECGDSRLSPAYCLQCSGHESLCTRTDPADLNPAPSVGATRSER